MTELIPIALFGWIPCVLLLFVYLPQKTAMVLAFLIASLFLPNASYELPGIPNYNKLSAATYGVLLATAIWNPLRFANYRPHWIDIFPAVWCLVPIPSAISNNIGGSITNAIYGGLSIMFEHTVTWGLPYFLGRLYFRTPNDLKILAVGILIGGLIYIPFCLIEVRMAPQFHYWVYGIAHRWGGIRFGGFRPTVFMDSGLQLGMWMTLSSLTGIYLWWSRRLKMLWGLPVGVFVVPLVMTTILCKSTGALALLLMGILALVVLRIANSKLALILLLSLSPTYCVVRSFGIWAGEGIAELTTAVVGEDRTESMLGRMWNEDLLIQHAMDHPWFGWSGWDRSSVYTEDGRRVTTQDGMWIIALGTAGLVGLVSLYGSLLAGSALLLAKLPTKRLRTTDFAPTLCVMTGVILVGIDFLMNAMPSPLYLMLAGCVASIASQPGGARMHISPVTTEE